MDRTKALKLLSEAAKAAQEGPLTNAEHTMLQFLRWVPRTIEEHGLQQALGVVIGVSRMSTYITPKIDPAIHPAFFAAEEIMRHDGLIPEQQVREMAAALTELGTRKAA